MWECLDYPWGSFLLWFSLYLLSVLLLNLTVTLSLLSLCPLELILCVVNQSSMWSSWHLNYLGTMLNNILTKILGYNINICVEGFLHNIKYKYIIFIYELGKHKKFTENKKNEISLKKQSMFTVPHTFFFLCVFFLYIWLLCNCFYVIHTCVLVIFQWHLSAFSCHAIFYKQY